MIDPQITSIQVSGGRYNVNVTTESAQPVLLFDDISLFHDIFLVKDTIYFVQFSYSNNSRSKEIQSCRESCRFYILGEKDSVESEIKPEFIYQGFVRVLQYTGRNLSAADTVRLKVIWPSGNITLELRRVSLPPRTGITQMTLFKDDAHFIIPWVEYHNRMGISRFLLYCNKPMGPHDFNELLSGLDIVLDVDIKFVEWDFRYWHGGKKDNYVAHHAQLPAMIDARFRIADTSKYILYNDLDEYIYLPPEYRTLIEYIGLYDRKDIQNIKFQELTAQLDTKEKIKDYRMLKERKTAKTWKGCLRSGKSAVKTDDYPKCMYVHGGTGPSLVMPTGMIHISNCSWYRDRGAGTPVDDNLPFDLDNPGRYEPVVHPQRYEPLKK